MKKVLLISLLATLFSCSMSKSLDREVIVKINSNIPVSTFNEGISHYSDQYNDIQYKEKLLKGIESIFSSSNVVINEAGAEFEIFIDQYTLTESTRMEKVTDSSATNFGQEYELSTIVVKSNGTVVRLSNGISYSWSAQKSKAEKITSLQTAGQIVSGENSDMKEYREKHFEENEAISLTYNCGTKSGASIVKQLSKALN